VPDGEILPAELLQAGAGKRLKIHELEHAVVPTTPYLRTRLERAEASVLMIEQLAVLDGRPLYVRVGYFPADRRDISATVADMDRRSRIPTAREAFEEISGLTLGRHESFLSAIPCEARTGRLLDVPEGDPVLMREALLFDQNGVPWELSYTHYRGDIHTIVAESH